MQLTKGPPKRPGGQGTGHLKHPEAFSGEPKGAPPAMGHVKHSAKRGGKHHVKGGM